MNRFFSRLGGLLLALLVLLVIGVVVARAMFDRYLRSEAFRRTLGDGAANALHANHAEFAPLQFDGAVCYSENFRAERGDGAGFSALGADQLRATFDWHGLLHHAVQIDELTIQRLSVSPPAPGAAFAPPPEAEPENSTAAAGRSSWKVDLRKVVVNDADFSWAAGPAAGGVTGMGLTMTPESGASWLIEAQGGRLKQPGWPAMDIENAQLRWQKPSLYINSSSLRNGSTHLSVTGSIEARQAMDLQVKIEGADIRPLVSEDWKKRIDGQLFGDISVQAPLSAGGNAAPSATASGKLSLNNGHLTALPILDQIGLFTRTERFRQLDLTRASADFTRTPDRTVVKNFVMESEGLIRVEGGFTISGGEIDGSFQVGLTPGTLQWIPGSQGQIFVASHDGYLWAPMRLTGPEGHPVDDLTPRLVAAAANGVIDKVQGTLQKASQGVLDLLLH